MTILWTVDGDQTSWAGWADNMANSPPSNLMCELIGRYSASPGEWALDLGCGVGRGFYPLVKAGYRVVGIDPDWRGLLYAAAKTKQGALAVWPVCAQAGYLPLITESMALVLAAGVIFHLSPPEMKLALREVTRVLCLSGNAILHFLDIEDWRSKLGKPTAPENVPIPGYKAVVTGFYSQDAIEILLQEAGFKLKSLELRVRQSEQGEMRDWVAIVQ